MTQSTAPDLISDPRPLMVRAAEQATMLIARTPPDRLDGATPCPQFDVRVLVGHLVAVMRRSAHLARGGAFGEVPSRTEGVADGVWGPAAMADLDSLRLAWADDTSLQRTYELPFGSVPGSGAVLFTTLELTVHGWDLAAATGAVDDLDPALAQAVLATARRLVPEQGRPSAAYGPPVPVPADAGDYPRLVGWLGRDPWWSA